ncbi:MAG: F0F1 ATP synthase subunit B [Anaerolineae bacterium]|nr:F0F1 ATP synthase subunit B [Anaerolineae bacterium]
MGALGFDLGSILWQLVAFGILLFVLYRFMYRPTLAMLDARAERVRQGLEQAEDARRQSDAARLEFERTLDEARKQGQQVVAEATKSAERARQDIEAQARLEAERVLEEARQRIENERRQALAAVHDEIVDLSIEATRRVLRQGIDEDMQRRLVGRFLQEESGDGVNAG